MEARSFEVYNLNSNLEHQVFVNKAQEHKAGIVGLSAFMSTAMNYMRDVIKLFKETGVRDQHMIIIGGAPISQKWSEVVSADDFALNAAHVVEVTQVLLRKKRAG